MAAVFNARARLGGWGVESESFWLNDPFPVVQRAYVFVLHAPPARCIYDATCSVAGLVR